MYISYYIFMQSFEFIDLILFLGASQGIFLAVTLQLVTKKNKAANKILSLLLLLVTITLLGRMLYFKYATYAFTYRIAALVDVIIFVFGPLSYMYIRRLIFNEKPGFRLSLPHFIPILGYLVFGFSSYTYTISEWKELLAQGALNLPFFITETAGIISNIVYVFLIANMIKKYKKEQQENLSYFQGLLSYLHTYIIAVSLFVIAWIFSYINFNLYYLNLNYISYNLIWVLISAFVFVIGFYSLKQPDIFRMPLIKEQETNVKERLSQETILQLKDSLEKLIVDEKIYLNHKLTLADLAKKLDTTTNNVSWLLNNIHKSTFYDFINKYRVKEFVRKIHKGEHHQHTLLALSMDAGFNSKSTFNKAFKAELNDTPSNYIKKLTTT